MNAEQHLESARRSLASLNKLDDSDDALAVIDATLIVGYHLGNALLHMHGVCGPSEHFNTPSKLEQPVDALPAPVRPGFEAFTALEALRTCYVRNPGRVDANAAAHARQLLATMARECGVAV